MKINFRNFLQYRDSEYRRITRWQRQLELLHLLGWFIIWIGGALVFITFIVLVTNVRPH